MTQFFAWATASETRPEAIVSGAGQFWLNLAGATAIDILPEGMIGLGVSAERRGPPPRQRQHNHPGNAQRHQRASVATALAAGDVNATNNVNAANVAAAIWFPPRASTPAAPCGRRAIGIPANRTRYYNIGAEEFQPMSSDVTYYVNGGNFNVDASVVSVPDHRASAARHNGHQRRDALLRQ